MARVLIIDDDAKMREMLEQTLRTAGYDVVSAANGKQGIELSRNGPANIVITNLVREDGLETIIELRRKFPGLAVLILLEAGDAEATHTVARRIRSARIVEKPFQPSGLLAAVEKALQCRE